MSDKNLAPYVRIRELDANGNPLAGGKLYTYRSGTSTPKQTYSDGDGTANSNPVVLDSEGSADVWIDDDEPYRFRLETSTGALRWQRDGITNASGSVLRSVANIAALKLISGSSTVTTIVDVAGYYAVGDGGGGKYRWDSTSTATDNGGTVIKATSVATGRWKLMHDNSVNVLQFGAKADGTNDSTYINNAAASGVARIVISSTHYMTSSITVPSDTTIEFLSGGAIDYDGTGNVFTSAGSLGTLYALASDVAKGATSFTVTAGNGANFAAGNSVWIQSEADALSYAGHKKGEIVTVLSVSSDTININGVFADGYTVATTAQAGVIAMKENIRYINPMITNRKWASATTTPTSSMIRSDFVRNLSITGGVLAKNNAAAFVTINCVDVKMHNVTARDLRDNTALNIYGYGVEAGGATIGMQITGCTFEKCRHGVTTGTASSGPTPNYGVQRGITVSGCTAIDCTAASFDTHEDSDGVTFTGNTVIRGSIVGISTRSYRTTITGNTIHGVKGNGIYTDITARNTTIIGNNISNCRKSGNTAGSERGHGIYVTGGGVTVSGNHVSFCDNFGIYVGDTNATGRDVSVTGNTVLSNCQSPSTTWAAANMSGIYVNSNGNPLAIHGNQVGDNQATKTQKYGIWVDVLNDTGILVSVRDNVCINNGTGPWLNTSGKALINFGGNLPSTMPGSTFSVETTTGSIAASTESDIAVAFGRALTAPSKATVHSILNAMYCTDAGANMVIRKLLSFSTTGCVVRVANTDAGGAHTGTIITTVTTRE